MRSHTPNDPARYLAPNKLIPLQGVIQDVAHQQSQGLETNSEKTRAFYDYIVRTMRYNKDGTGWGQGSGFEPAAPSAGTAPTSTRSSSAWRAVRAPRRAS